MCEQFTKEGKKVVHTKNLDRKGYGLECDVFRLCPDLLSYQGETFNGRAVRKALTQGKKFIADKRPIVLVDINTEDGQYFG